MTDAVTEAVRFIQERILSQKITDIYSIERYERALDALLRHPDRDGIPYRLARDAVADGGKAIKRRRLITHNLYPDQLPRIEGSTSSKRKQHTGTTTSTLPTIELIDFVFTDSTISDSDRMLLISLVTGSSAEEIASEMSTSLKNVRVRISRARSNALRAWEASDALH